MQAQDQRGGDANADAALEKELLSDEKELAEHKMLIDLARNDIGRVSEPKSVVVKNAMHNPNLRKGDPHSKRRLWQVRERA